MAVILDHSNVLRTLSAPTYSSVYCVVPNRTCTSLATATLRLPSGTSVTLCWWVGTSVTYASTFSSPRSSHSLSTSTKRELSGQLRNVTHLMLNHIYKTDQRYNGVYRQGIICPRRELHFISVVSSILRIKVKITKDKKRF